MKSSAAPVPAQASSAARTRAAELVVRYPRHVRRPQPESALAGDEVRVAGAETAVTAWFPAVERQPVLPHTDVEPASADHVRGHLVRQHHGGVRVLLQDQPVDAVEQRTALRGERCDVVPRGLVDHGSSAQRVHATPAVIGLLPAG